MSDSSIVYNVSFSLTAAALQLVVSIVAFYRFFTSKYGRWKKDLDQLAKTMQQLPGVPMQVEYADIKKATNNFLETAMLGKGGFGAVYRCTLPNLVRGKAQEVAVKKFTRNNKHNRYDDFLGEASVIHRLSHKNIAPLMGWSYNKGEALLIYEYMSNGSLDQHLFQSDSTTLLQQENKAILQWKTRYDIVSDIATGLRYIHDEHDPMVLHRDIKASNIMLDSNLRGRLGDFGIACTVDVNKSSVTFNGKILGTWGYIAPEYAESCEATRQSDIYAFGVLVLEIVSGRQWDDVKPEHDHITDWIWRLHGQGKLLQAVDRNMLTTAEKDKEEVAFDEAERMLLLGLACTHPDPSNRPSMVDAVQVINKSAPPPHVPRERPTFTLLPPAEGNLRSQNRNSVYSTDATTLTGTGSSASMVELASEEEQPLSADTTGHVSSFYDSMV